MDMTKAPNIAGLLGLARRAGKLILGTDGVETGIRRRSIYTVIIAKDASPATAKRIKDLAQKHSVPFFVIYLKHELGGLMGRRELAVLGIADPFFADGVSRNFSGRQNAWRPP
jgi:ribosomal protein L7Ae-like RNA K-turn-binding protein